MLENCNGNLIKQRQVCYTHLLVTDRNGLGLSNKHKTVTKLNDFIIFEHRELNESWIETKRNFRTLSYPFAGVTK